MQAMLHLAVIVMHGDVDVAHARVEAHNDLLRACITLHNHHVAMHTLSWVCSWTRSNGLRPGSMGCSSSSELSLSISIYTGCGGHGAIRRMHGLVITPVPPRAPSPTAHAPTPPMLRHPEFDCSGPILDSIVDNVDNTSQGGTAQQLVHHAPLVQGVQRQGSGVA